MRLLAISLSFPLSACGIGVQSLIGWNVESKAVVAKTHQVRIDSSPSGAELVRRSPAGDAQNLGTTPFVDTVEYQVEETTSDPRAWGLLGTGLGELLLGSILAGVGRTQADARCGTVGGDGGVHNCGEERSVPLYSSGGILLTFGLVDSVWGVIRLLSSPEVTESRVIDETVYEYTARKGGRESVANIPVPKSPGATIDLLGGTPVALPPPPPLPPLPAALDARVVAVMDVEDANEGTGGGVGDSLVRNLSDQIRVFVTQQGVRTIDRSAQERAFRSQVTAVKAESYDDCYDDTCQIELGKALAASHILRSKITKFGSKCVLNGELVDLYEEVTIKAASSQGTCEAEGFLTMSEVVARDLMKR